MSSLHCHQNIIITYTQVVKLVWVLAQITLKSWEEPPPANSRMGQSRLTKRAILTHSTVCFPRWKLPAWDDDACRGVNNAIMVAHALSAVYYSKKKEDDSIFGWIRAELIYVPWIQEIIEKSTVNYSVGSINCKRRDQSGIFKKNDELDSA